MLHQLVQGLFDGGDVLRDVLALDQSAVPPQGRVQDRVGLHDAGVRVVVRQPLVEPAGELAREGHQRAVVKLAVGQLVDAFGDQHREPGGPQRRTVVGVGSPPALDERGQDRLGVDGVPLALHEKAHHGLVQDVDRPLDLVQAAGLPSRGQFHADHVEGEPDPALGLVGVVHPIALVRKNLADDLLDQLLVGRRIEVAELAVHLDRGGLHLEPARPVGPLEAVLVNGQAAVVVPQAHLTTGGDGVFRDGVPQLDRVGQILGLPEELDEQVVLPALRCGRRRLPLWQLFE